MTLDQDYNEQARWVAHLAQERQALSSSMEATLAEGSVLDEEDEWDDAPQGRIPANQSLIPPRLSLQSKVLPTVKPEKSAPLAVVPASEVVEASASTADGNIFMRLARRLTSSLAALTLPPSDGMASNTPVTNIRVDAQPEMARDRDTERTASYRQQEHMQMIQASEVYHVAQDAYIVDALPAPVTTPVEEAMPQEKRRLAGHTAKVRLQTTDMPAVAVKAKEADIPFMSAVPTSVQPVKEQPTQLVTPPAAHAPHMPDLSSEGARQTSVQLPAITKVRQEETPTRPRKTLTGTGTFESGQGDVMIENAHVTDASVVIVTLTSNPGPVVVQYVSLYPHVGFTVHLTAPAAAKTSFNYIILLGELF